MLTDLDGNCARSEHPRRRVRCAGAPGRAAALVVVVAAGLLATAPVSARVPSGGATVFVHSATSGELSGGRLTLRGVGGRVTWAHNRGRSGVLRITRLHRMLFAPAKSAVTGALHVAGHRGGEEPTFKLSRPRHSAAHSTVSCIHHECFPARPKWTKRNLSDQHLYGGRGRVVAQDKSVFAMRPHGFRSRARSE
jgi:hypothetical protein